ncbi:MAG: ATP-binding protein [Paracoccaceae bacterium]|nr:ATP-binding protein [Paracoccaceae bacterium]
MIANSKPIQGSPNASVHRQSRSGLPIGIHWIMFFSLLLASVPPLVVLYKWMERSAILKEITYVDENHLIIAKNLAAAIERYSNDVALVFELASKSLQADENLDLRETLDAFDLRFVALVNPSNVVEKIVRGTHYTSTQSFLPEQLTQLRALVAIDPSETHFSGLQNFDEKPHFFLVRSLPEEMLAIAVLTPRYLVELQKSIIFGERGHSMMVDQNGLVIAHPNSEWQANSKDASKLSVVQKMIAGETGVATFYSPPMQADMISGFTFVARTGWGVMVPQPMSELIGRAKSSEKTALYIVLVEIIMLIILSWWLSHQISTPIKNVEATAKKVSAGDLNARVIVKDGIVAISEVRLLGTSFNRVISDLQYDRIQLADALHAAQEGDRAKSRFLTMASHEIRTPMHGLVGVLDLLEEGKLEDDQRQLLVVGKKAASNLVGILDSVLSFVRLEVRAEISQVYAFNPAELAQSTVDLFQPMASQKDLSLTTSVSNQMMNGDPKMINHVLLNLVGNAVKFTKKGKIHISSELRNFDTDDARLVISVSDSGIGIPEDLQGKIFDEFTQVETELSRNYEGTGLGLAISVRLAELMKGEITLVSKPNEGSCFCLNVPVSVLED